MHTTVVAFSCIVRLWAPSLQNHIHIECHLIFPTYGTTTAYEYALVHLTKKVNNCSGIDGLDESNRLKINYGFLER